MAKNADDQGAAKSRADQLRAAVEGAFGATTQGAAPVQKRAQDLADELVNAAGRLREALSGEELAGAAGRVRGALDDLRPASLEELDALRRQVEALEARVAELEAAMAAPAPARRAKPKPKPKPPA